MILTQKGFERRPFAILLKEHMAQSDDYKSYVSLVPCLLTPLSQKYLHFQEKIEVFLFTFSDIQLTVG